MTDTLRFVAGDLDSDDVRDLLVLHLSSAAANSPADSVHALDLSRLRDPAVRFWAVRDAADGALVGMGALNTLGPGHGEIKSMRVATAYAGRGIGAAILDHLLAQARATGLTRISLETGGNDVFAAARALYERAGFTPCGAFGDYVPGDFTRCYTLTL